MLLSPVWLLFEWPHRVGLAMIMPWYKYINPNLCAWGGAEKPDSARQVTQEKQ